MAHHAYVGYVPTEQHNALGPIPMTLPQTLSFPHSLPISPMMARPLPCAPVLPSTPSYSRPSTSGSQQAFPGAELTAAAVTAPFPPTIHTSSLPVQQHPQHQQQQPHLKLALESLPTAQCPDTWPSFPITPPVSADSPCSWASSPALDNMMPQVDPMVSGMGGLEKAKNEANGIFSTSEPITPGVDCPTDFIADNSFVDFAPHSPSPTPSLSYGESSPTPSTYSECLDPKALFSAKIELNDATPCKKEPIEFEQTACLDPVEFWVQSDFPTVQVHDFALPSVDAALEAAPIQGIKRRRASSLDSHCDLESLDTTVHIPKKLRSAEPTSATMPSFQPETPATPQRKGPVVGASASPVAQTITLETSATCLSIANPKIKSEKESPCTPASHEGPVEDSADESLVITGPAPQKRRGRKQSFSDDPTKQFPCNICDRRFRRQEHLKRHHRSLHTSDKPFKCEECNKVFSRSDNLAQHARTHGSGNIPLDLVDTSRFPLGGHEHAMAEYAHMGNFNFGRVIYQATADMPGSDMSADESGPDANLRLIHV